MDNLVDNSLINKTESGIFPGFQGRKIGIFPILTNLIQFLKVGIFPIFESKFCSLLLFLINYLRFRRIRIFNLSINSSSSTSFSGIFPKIFAGAKIEGTQILTASGSKAFVYKVTFCCYPYQLIDIDSLSSPTLVGALCKSRERRFATSSGFKPRAGWVEDLPLLLFSRSLVGGINPNTARS